MPKELAAIELKRLQVLSIDNGILAAKWKHKKDMCLLSTKRNKIEMIEPRK